MKLLLRRYNVLFLLGALIFAGCDQSNVPTTSLSDDTEDVLMREAGDIIPGQYIVVLKPSTELF